MIEHILWFKFKPSISDERIEEHFKALRSLQDKISGIESVHLGKDFAGRANGFTHGMVMTMKDQASLENYGPHPEHQLVAKALKADAEILAMDFAFKIVSF